MTQLAGALKKAEEQKIEDDKYFIGIGQSRLRINLENSQKEGEESTFGRLTRIYESQVEKLMLIFFTISFIFVLYMLA